MNSTAVKNTDARIILASASPRRREILTDMGVTFTVLSADTDETCSLTEPVALTTELARRKGLAVLSLLRERGDADGAIIISADTVVACNGKILGKPRSADEARAMLSMLSGTSHTVATGIAVTYKGIAHTACSTTVVHVDDIPPAELEKYVASGEPFDKAGGYGIQGRFSQWIRGIDGCFFGVVGLPINLLSKLFYDTVGCYPNDLLFLLEKKKQAKRK